MLKSDIADTILYSYNIIMTNINKEKLKKAKNKEANLEMLKLGLQSQKEIKNLPSDLREKANEILYSNTINPA